MVVEVARGSHCLCGVSAAASACSRHQMEWTSVCHGFLGSGKTAH